jgi:hypothetical protein
MQSMWIILKRRFFFGEVFKDELVFLSSHYCRLHYIVGTTPKTALDPQASRRA